MRHSMEKIIPFIPYAAVIAFFSILIKVLIEFYSSTGSRRKVSNELYENFVRNYNSKESTLLTEASFKAITNLTLNTKAIDFLMAFRSPLLAISYAKQLRRIVDLSDAKIHFHKPTGFQLHDTKDKRKVLLWIYFSVYFIFSGTGFLIIVLVQNSSSINLSLNQYFIPLALIFLAFLALLEVAKLGAIKRLIEEFEKSDFATLSPNPET